MVQGIRQWQAPNGDIYRQISSPIGGFQVANSADILCVFVNQDAIQGSRGGQLLAAQIAVQTTATVGNRQITLDFVVADPVGNIMVLASAKSKVLQPFSSTYYYQFSRHQPDSAALEAGSRVHVQLPEGLELPPQCFLTPYDAAAIDVATDGYQARGGYLTKERSLSVTL